MAGDSLPDRSWYRTYEFATDVATIASMQEASQSPRTDTGRALAPALIGSPEWWAMVDDGRLPVVEVEGLISEVYWGSMRDWPEFTLRLEDGTTRDWARKGDVRRYAAGLRARVRYVRHPWKPALAERHGGEVPTQVLTIDVEESERRSSGIAPTVLENPDEPPALRCGLRVGETWIFLGGDLTIGAHAADGARRERYQLEVEVIDPGRRAGWDKVLGADPDAALTGRRLTETSISMLSEYVSHLNRNSIQSPGKVGLSLLSVDKVQPFDYGFMIAGECLLRDS